MTDSYDRQQLLVRRERGFTMIELVLVCTVIALLAAISVPVFLSQRERSVDAGIKRDMRSAVAAAEAITVEKPTDASPSTASVFSASAMASAGFKLTGENRILIAGSPAEGYCVIGGHYTNAGSPVLNTTWFWWDSEGGGMLPGKPTGTPAGMPNCTGTFYNTHHWVQLF